MNEPPLRAGLPPLPERMAQLPLDARGYPIPWFVANVDGKRDFRVADGDKLRRAVRFRLCFQCGEKLGRLMTFVIGPMCAINRVIAEPPNHKECATFAATACPFLSLPKAQRREANLPTENISEPGGVMLKRNPGAVCLWTTLRFTIFFDAGDKILFKLGDPEEVLWYAEGRSATRAEVMESIDSGLPLLENVARQQGLRACEALVAGLTDAKRHLPCL